MQKFSLALPAMFADHHVQEVRRLLSALNGVIEIYASSAFQIVEVAYEPGLTGPDAIRQALQDAGYMECPPGPVEIHADPATQDAARPFFRRTADIPNIRTIGFTQKLPTVSRPLWPCPGLPHQSRKKEVDHG